MYKNRKRNVGNRTKLETEEDGDIVLLWYQRKKKKKETHTLLRQRQLLGFETYA